MSQNILLNTRTHSGYANAQLTIALHLTCSNEPTSDDGTYMYLHCYSNGSVIILRAVLSERRHSFTTVLTCNSIAENAIALTLTLHNDILILQQ